VTQAETRNAFRPLREDLTRTSTAYLIVELADALTEEAMEQPELFDLLTATLRALGTTDDPRLVAAHYQLRLLDVAGFRPVLMQCVVCHADLEPGRNAFSAFLGGALCPHCGPGEPSARPIDTDVLKVLRNLQRAGPPGSAHFRAPELVMREVERTLRDLIERHTERRLRSPDLLARLRADPAFSATAQASDSVGSPGTEDRHDSDDLAAPSRPVESKL
jgi:DNA repair protein RecO (recombination protein O)